MATTKLTSEQIKELAAIKITGVKTVEDASAKMISYLAKNEIDGVDDESYQELFNMSEVIFQGSDDELDEAAKEVAPKKADKKATKVAPIVAEEEDEDEDEDEDEEEDEDETEAEDEVTLEDMKVALIASGLKKKAVSELSEKKIIAAYSKLQEEDDEDEDEEDEAEEVAPAPKKGTVKPVAKPVVAKPAVAKAVVAKKVSKKISPLTNPEDEAKFDKFKADLTKLLKGHEVGFNFIANGGLSVRIIGKNGSKVILSYDTPKYDKDEKIVASVFMPTKDEKLLSELFGEDIEIKSAWSGALHATNLSFSDVIGAFKENKETLDKLVNTIIKKDEKLGKNREKMEADLKSTKTAKIDDIKAKGKTKEKEVEEPAKDKKKDKKKSKK